MNNKGQTLVLFVLILPIVFLLIYFVLYKTYLEQEKNHQKDILEILCNYSKKETNNEKIKELGLVNDKDLEIKIQRKNDKLEITLTKETKLFKKEVKTSSMCE